jgi:hypothetical protein
MVAADPAHRGTFTVAALDSAGAPAGESGNAAGEEGEEEGAAGTALIISVTRDGGKAWSKPVRVTDDADTQKFKAAVAYSPGGVLGMVWRSNTQPGSEVTIPYNVFVATSKDQGATWSAPLRVTSKPSPGSDPGFDSGGLDDLSYISLNGKDVFTGWGDWRPGEVQGYFSAAKLAAFKKQSSSDRS